MAAESIGTLIPTKIPGLADAADIQAALRLYHYGSYTFDTASTSTAALVNPSIAYEIQSIKDDITTLENRPSSGGQVNTTSPAYTSFTPTGIPDGYIWVDEDGTLGGAPTGATAVFTNTAPTSSLTTGTIWVDKDATTITANPFIPQAIIAAKGDLLAGSANDEVVVLSVGTNGQYLKADSSTTSGLAWGDPGDLTAVSGGTGITVTNGTGPVPSIAVDTTLVATTSNTMTLSNKTLTAPTLQNPSSTSGTFVAPTIQNGAYTGGVHIGGTFTSAPTIDRSTLSGTTLISQIKETTTVSATTAATTVNYDILTNGAVTYYTNNSGANWTLNLRGSSTTSLANMMSVGESLTVAFLVTNGSTAYYQSAFQIDGSSVTPKWQGGTAPTSGNASSIDIYSITATRINSTSTVASAFTVFESQTKFA